MAQRHAHSQPIQTYGPAPHNRNIWPHNSRATVFCLRFWPILLSVFQAPSYPLLMYMTYVRKWLLLQINRIICPEVAVNGQFFAWKIEFFNCLKKSKLSEICLQNSIFFCKIA